MQHYAYSCKFENTKHRWSGCFFTNVIFTAVSEIGIRGEFCEKLSYINWVQLVFRSSYLILNWRAYTFLLHIHVKYEYRIPFMIWKCRRHFQMYLQWNCLNFNYNFTDVCSQGSNWLYRKTSNISRTCVDNKIVDNSDVVGASPVGAAPTTSSFST